MFVTLSARGYKMRKILFQLVVIILITFCANAQNVFNYTQVNTDQDDYAATFRSTCSGVEVWLTNNRTGNSKSRKIVVANVTKNGFSPVIELPYPVNQKQERGKEDLYLDGSPSFNACDPNYGVFVSNRIVDGKTYDNDIYELQQTPQGWNVKRLDNINSKFWDDSPTLSPDGRYLYFASSRSRPGLGVSDIYISQKLDNGIWSNPDKLQLQGYSLGTPLVSQDGFLYYSVDQQGNNDLDIWRVKLNQITGKPIEGSEEPIPISGVNKQGSNQADPSFSPGTSWFMFSSDENPKKKRDLFYTLVKNVFDTIVVKSSLRTYEYDSLSAEFIDVIKPYSEQVEAQDSYSGLKAAALPSSDGLYRIMLPSSVGNSPSEDRRIREVIIHSKVNSIRNLSASDTLIYEVGNHCRLEHNLTVWDVNVLENPDCKQNFPITKVEFFVTSYWCPTTKKYSKLTSCQTVFDDPECVVISTPPKPCENNDLYRYKVNPATIDRIPQQGLCLPHEEVNLHAKEWSENVDKAIDTFVDKMGTALQKPCITRSIRENEKVVIEVTGWTDPRSLDKSCLYTGSEINFNTTAVKLKNLSEKSQYIPNGILKNGTPFVKSPNNGNQLLSDARAYFTSVLLDSLWKLTIPKYKHLRDRGLIEVLAVGKSVNPDQIALAKQRSVNVVVLTNLKSKTTAANTPELGRSIALCSNGCLENLMCRTLEQTTNVDLAQEVITAPVKKEEIISTQIVNPTPIKSQLFLEDKKGSYSLQFASYPEESRAKDVSGKLAAMGVQNIKIVTYTNILGTVYYKVKVGNYPSIDEALQFKKSYDDVRSKIGLSKIEIIEN